MMETEEMSVEKWIEKQGLQYTAKFVPFSLSRNAKEKTPSLNWQIEISKGSWVVFTSQYTQGVGNLPGYKFSQSHLMYYHDAVKGACETGRWNPNIGGLQSKLQAPKIADVLHCLLVDATAIDYSFEDWCGEFGYDTDSRKAFQMYETCVQTGLTLRRMGIDLNEAREVFQDY